SASLMPVGRSIPPLLAGITDPGYNGYNGAFFRCSSAPCWSFLSRQRPRQRRKSGRNSRVRKPLLMFNGLLISGRTRLDLRPLKNPEITLRINFVALAGRSRVKHSVTTLRGGGHSS